MQTKQQIQQLLTSAGIRPNKKLDQNFLIDLNLMRLLVDSAQINSSDIVLEVGCGTGSLTEAISEKAGKVIGVELDRTLDQIAKKRLAKKGNIKIINTDILENKNAISKIVTSELELAGKEASGRLLLVSNLPYSVACPVMMNLVTGEIAADRMYVTVQKEVAERMTATPASGDYGILSIILAAAGDVKRLKTLKPAVFWPQPQIDSAMVSFVRKAEKVRRIEDMAFFSEVVNLFMAHRRKMLRACTKLANGRLVEIHNWQGIFEQCGIDPCSRGEQLWPEDFISIAKLCSEYLNDG